MSDKIREAQAMHLLNEISEAPNGAAIYACLDRIDVFLGKKEGVLEWPVAALAQQPAAAVPVAWQARFTDPGQQWDDCTKEHHDFVKANPSEWSGYEVRELFATPPAAEQPECGCCGQTGPCDPDCDCAEQPDTVKVPRWRTRAVLAMILNALDRDAAGGSVVRGEMAAELRALLGKESEDHE